VTHNTPDTSSSALASHDSHIWSITWPPERFFWALIDPSKLPRSLARQGIATSHPALDELIVDQLPLPLHELHVVYQRVSNNNNRLIACAARTNDLRDLPIETLELKASHLPRWLDEALTPIDTHPDLSIMPESDHFQHETIAQSSAASLPNVLIGTHAPHSIRRHARHRDLIFACTLLSLCLCLALGMNRRAAASRTQAQNFATATAGLVRANVPSLPASWPAIISELETEHHNFTRTRTQPMIPPRDAAEVLAGLLARWPLATSVQTQSLRVAEDQMTITVSTSLVDNARAFANNIIAPSGWVLSEPQLSSSGNASILMISAYRDQVGSTSPGGAP